MIEQANTQSNVATTLPEKTYEDEPIQSSYIPLRSKKEHDKLVESMLMWW